MQYFVFSIHPFYGGLEEETLDLGAGKFSSLNNKHYPTNDRRMILCGTNKKVVLES